MVFPLLTPIPREGTLRCGSAPTLGAPVCGAPATWHIAWWFAPKADFSLVCDQHMNESQRNFVYEDRHPADHNCDMPGTGWLTAHPSQCVPVSSTDVAAARAVESLEPTP